MVLEMVMVYFIISKVVDMMVIGMIIKCKDMENYSIPMEELHIKDNGCMIHYMERVSCLINSLTK